MENKKYKKIGIYDNCFNPFVFDEIPENSKCLDVGCWNGNLGCNLINKKKCIVDGIDVNTECLDVAKNRGYRNVYNFDFNKDYTININEKYDCIIFADVLEHLTNPNDVLNNIGCLLRENGEIIISIPNIAFILQRVLLLFGRFDYNKFGGIMDYTHLRFFTKKSIISTVEESGFQIEKFYGYALVKNKFFYLRFLAKIFPKLFALQFILKVKK